MSVDEILTQVLLSGSDNRFGGSSANDFLGNLAPRRFRKQVLEVGGTAAVVGVAAAAWRHHRRFERHRKGSVAELFRASGASHARSIHMPVHAGGHVDVGLVILRAMIAAADATGQLDDEHIDCVFERVGSLPISGPDKAHLLAQLASPLDLNTLVADASELGWATMIYAATRLAIGRDIPTGRGYLRELRSHLQLPDGVARAIDAELAPPEFKAHGRVTRRPATARSAA